jgi:hypothetical protein
MMDNVFGILNKTFWELLIRFDLHVYFLLNIFTYCCLLYNLLQFQTNFNILKVDENHWNEWCANNSRNKHGTQINTNIEKYQINLIKQWELCRKAIHKELCSFLKRQNIISLWFCHKVLFHFTSKFSLNFKSFFVSYCDLQNHC